MKGWVENEVREVEGVQLVEVKMKLDKKWKKESM